MARRRVTAATGDTSPSAIVASTSASAPAASPVSRRAVAAVATASAANGFFVSGHRLIVSSLSAAIAR